MADKYKDVINKQAEFGATAIALANFNRNDENYMKAQLSTFQSLSNDLYDKKVVLEDKLIPLLEEYSGLVVTKDFIDGKIKELEEIRKQLTEEPKE